MRYKFSWNTYASDGGCCVQSVRSALALGVDPALCTVFVTRGKPLTHDVANTFAAMGVTVSEGLYTRRDTFGDVIARLRECIYEDTDVVWHVDSDVVLNNLDALEVIARPEVKAVAAAWGRCEFSGCSFLLRCDAAAAALEETLENNPLGLPLRGTPEDIMIGMLMCAQFGRASVVQLPSQHCGWYRFKRNWEVMSASGWVHFGQKKDARPFTGGNMRARDVIAAHMKEYQAWKATAT